MSTASIEATAQRQVLHISSSNNVVVRGMVVEHAASCMNMSAAVVSSGSNVLLDSDVFNWNDFGGLGISGTTYVTVQNSVASYNGGAGMNPGRIQHGLLSNVEADYNGWRAAQGGFYDFAMGGIKVFTSHYVTINGAFAYNNSGEGLWFDTDNENISVSNAVLVGNLIDNLKTEASAGPFNITGNTMCYGGVGWLLTDSAGVTFEKNFLYGNGWSIGDIARNQNGQMFLAGAAGGRTYTNFVTHAYEDVENTNETIEGNTFAQSGPGQYVFRTYLSGTDWSDFAKTSISDSNTYAGSASGFVAPPTYKATNLAGWQSNTGFDHNSTWATVQQSAACAVPQPAYPDFTLLTFDNINNPPASWSFSGSTLAIPLQIQSFNHGAISLSVQGLPSGVTASFSQSQLTSGNVTLTLHAQSAAKQTVPITVFGTSADRVRTITLNNINVP